MPVQTDLGFAAMNDEQLPWHLLRSAIASDEDVLETLRSTLQLAPQTLRIGGRDVTTPRLVSYHGDVNAEYGYSGRSFRPSPWTPELQGLRAQVEEIVHAQLQRSISFNSVLANYYRDGADAMGFHSDDEPELGPSAPHDVVIASLSLGAYRRFVLRNKLTGKRFELQLGRGDLLVMHGDGQTRFAHAIPRTTKVVGTRMNLTFRVIVPRESCYR